MARLWPPIVVVGLGALLFATHVAFLVAQANHALTLFAGFPFDGAMQHLNALYRLADGQRPAGDFPAFQGPAVPVVHYPLFAVFGGDFFGAELSRRISAGVAGTLAPFAFVCAIARRRRTIAITALALTPMLLWPWLRELSLPGVSLIGVRAAPPLLAVALLYWLSTSARPRAASVRRGPWLEVIAGLSAALAFLLGTEHGIGLLVGVVVAILVTEARGRHLRQRARSAAVVGGSFAGGVLVLGAAVMGTGVIDGIRYALVDVPADQGWYFGAPPNKSLVDLEEVTTGNLTGPALRWVATLGLLAPVGVWLARRRDPGAWAVLALSVYGLFSMVALLGYVKVVNVTVASRVLVLVAVWFLVVVVHGRLPARVGGVRTAAVLAVLWVAFAAVPVLGQAKREMGYVRAEIANPPAPQGSYAGVGLNREWSEHVQTLDRLARTDCRTLWSTYGGVAEAERGVQNPTGYDYLIHTVGSRREPYLKAFDQRRPDCFSTSRRSALLGYEEWLWNANWDLYRRLLDRYRPKATTPFSLVWERAAEPQLEEVARVSLGPVATGQTIPLPAADPARPITMYVIRVRYRAGSPLGALPLVGTLPRYLVRRERTLAVQDVSLPPDRTSWEFPVLAGGGAAPALRFEALSVLPGAKLDVEDVTVSTVELPQETLAFWTEAPGGPSPPIPIRGRFSGF